jgi:hypothetical protein
MGRPLVIYDFATSPFLISRHIYEENLILFFISVGNYLLQVEIVYKIPCCINDHVGNQSLNSQKHILLSLHFSMAEALAACLEPAVSVLRDRTACRLN